MGDENTDFSLEVVQELKRKVCPGKELTLFEGLILVAACASNKGAEWIQVVRERSKSQESGATTSSALESLRKLNAEKLICKRRDESVDEDHTHLGPNLKENLDDRHGDSLVAQDMVIFTSERDENAVATENIRKNDDDDRAFELRKREEKVKGSKKKYYSLPSSGDEDLPEEYVKYLALLRHHNKYFTSKDHDHSKKKKMVSFNGKMQNSSAFKSQRNYGVDLKTRKRSKNDAEDQNYDLDSKKSNNSVIQSKNMEKNRWKYNSSPNTIHQDLPEKLKGKIATSGGDNDRVPLVSDLEKQQDRLSMPVNQVLCKYSESDEVKRFENTKDEEMKKMVSFNGMKQKSSAFESRRNYGIRIREPPKRSYENDDEDDEDYNLESKKSKNNKGVKRPRPESKMSENEGNSNVKKPRYKSPPTIVHRELPENFKRKIETMGGDSDKAKLVFQKCLYDSDIARQQNRFSMPINQLPWKEFLEPDEVERLADGKKYMDITIIDPMGEEEQVRFKKFIYKKTVQSYVLIKQWCDVAEKNHLKCGDLIQVWAFRDLKNNLHLAMVKRDENSDGASSSNAATANTSSDGGEGSSNANTSASGGEGSSNANASFVGGEGNSGDLNKEDSITVGVLVEVSRNKVSSEKSMEES